MAKRTPLIVAALGAVAGGCLSGARPDGRPASDPQGRIWREVRTERFIVVTDLDLGLARARARELDELAGALADLYPATSSVPAPREPLRVIHLARCEEVHRVMTGADPRPSGMATLGFVSSSIDPLVERLMVTCEADRSRLEIVLHELTHDLNGRYFEALPPWLDEGLATYYQTLTLRHGMVVLGNPPASDAALWKVPPTRLPTMKQVLEASYDEIAGRKQRTGYFAAWKLTHLLLDGSSTHRRRFLKMLQALVEGMPGDAAFTAAFGDIRDRVDQEYTSYGQGHAVAARNRPYSRPVPVAALPRSERQLERGEVQGLWIELGLSRATGAEMLERLGRLEREAPEWPGRFYWSAMVHYRFQLPGASPVALLRQYVARQPGDVRGWLALVALEMDELRPAGDLGVEPIEPSPELEGMASDVARLGWLARRPSELNMIGAYFALCRRPTIGLPFTLRALAAEPGCAVCLDTLATLSFQSGRIEDAASEQRRAVAMVSERARRGPASGTVRLQRMKDRLLYYERAASAAGAPAPVGSSLRDR
ncbi:MAG TPA: hypothetical protein VEL05_03185, partial [Candidatus Acidoferrum sp.]|nr:hypothetical protein [Candidatus Acidoferrum sp.]